MINLMNIFKSFIFIAVFVLVSNSAMSQIYIDTVYLFTPGTEQNAGQSTTYFPNNIYGPITETAQWTVPASSPYELCSIGVNGEIIVGFKNAEIIDGPGDDFAIFENTFLRLADSLIFAEPAKVAVSEDGINYYEFPFDSLTLNGCAGKTPSIGTFTNFTEAEVGGDWFDLAKVGLGKARFIKITDISKIVANYPGSPFYSPAFLISGFDLDALAAVNYKITGTSITKPSAEPFIIQHSNDQLNITVNNNLKAKLSLYDLLGNQIYSASDNGFKISIQNLPCSTILLAVEIDGKTYFRHLISK